MFSRFCSAFSIFLASILFSSSLESTNPDFDNPYDEESESFISQATIKTKQIPGLDSLQSWSGGEFIEKYGYPISQKAVCWSLEENPGINGDCTNEGDGMEDYSSRIKDLLPNREYYVRAYATNRAGTVYGNQQSFRSHVELDLEVTGKGIVRQEIIEGNQKTSYPYESMVKLTAIPEPGWTFKNWEGDLQGDKNPAELLLDKNKDVLAAFQRLRFLFSDQFIDNRNNWGTWADDLGFARIEDGYLVLSFQQAGYYRRSFNSITDYSFRNDFAIEFQVNMDDILGSSNYSRYFALEWNLLFGRGTTQRQMAIHSDGNLFIGDRIKGTWDSSTFSWTRPFSGYSEGNMINVMLAKEGRRYRIHLNNQLSESLILTNEPASTGTLAFFVANLTYSIDYIEVEALTNNNLINKSTNKEQLNSIQLTGNNPKPKNQ
jgi:hypothetical protein